MIRRSKNPTQFDSSKVLVATRTVPCRGHKLVAGQPVPDGLDAEGRVRLWLMDYAEYEEDFRPTPQQGVAGSGAAAGGGAASDTGGASDTAWQAEADGVRVDGPNGAWFTIVTVANGDESKEQGEANAKAAAEALRAAHRNSETGTAAGAATGDGADEEE
jgi:hypothetical protein